MATSNILSEYFVSLGFSTDRASLARFSTALHDAASLVDNQTFAIAKNLFKWQTAIVGGFAAVGAGAIGLVDKVAMADQEYRLLALRMYTTLPVARELKVAMDALGQPLENIAWDPELARRFGQLVKDQQAMTRALGPAQFEKTALRLRDIRAEFGRLGVEIGTYLPMFLTKDIGNIFGVNIDDIDAKLHKLNDYIVQHMPEINEWLEKKLKPILHDIKDVLDETWATVKLGAVAFQNLEGVLSDDKSLEGTTASFQKMGKAIQDAIRQMKEFAESGLGVFKMLFHLVNVGALIKSGDFKGAESELRQAEANLTAGSGTVLGLAAGAPFGPAGMVAGAGLGYIGGLRNEVDVAHYQSSVDEEAHKELIKKAIVTLSTNMGVDPRITLAIAQHESGFRQVDALGRTLINPGTPGHPSHATGVFQIQPSTAVDVSRYLGQNINPAIEGQNLIGGVGLTKMLLEKFHGDQERMLEAYYGNTWQPGANREYARQIQSTEAMVKIGSLQITLPPSAVTPQEIHKSTLQALTDWTNKMVQRNQQEFSGPYQ